MSMLIMDIAIFMVGMYLAKIAYGMMKSKKASQIILPPEEMKKCKDEAAFVEYIAPRMRTFSIFTMIAALVGAYFDIMNAQNITGLLGAAIFLISLLVFWFQFQKAKKEFFF